MSEELQEIAQQAAAYKALKALMQRRSDEAEQFIQAAIDQAPEPLRRLGEYLTRVLDEDQWKTAEGMLLGAATAPPVPDGWKLVPVELTEAMSDAFHKQPEDGNWEDSWTAAGRWAAMLAAAPEVPHAPR